MKQVEKELLTNEIEHKIGMVRTFHKDKDGADELIEGYEDYRKEGVSVTEAKLLLEDLNLFLETVKG